MLCARSRPDPPTSPGSGTSSTPRARSSAARHRGRDAAARQAQADLGAARRHRRPRDRRSTRRSSRSRRARATDKLYHRHTGYPGGIRTESLEHLLARDPEKVVRLAVRRMLPKGPLGRADAEEAEGLRRPDPPAPGAAARRRGRCPTRAHARASTRLEKDVARAQAPHPDHRSPQGSGRARAPASRYRQDHGQRPAVRRRTSRSSRTRSSPRSRCGSRRPKRSTTSTPRSTAAA